MHFFSATDVPFLELLFFRLIIPYVAKRLQNVGDYYLSRIESSGAFEAFTDVVKVFPPTRQAALGSFVTLLVVGSEVLSEAVSIIFSSNMALSAHRGLSFGWK